MLLLFRPSSVQRSSYVRLCRVVAMCMYMTVFSVLRQFPVCTVVPRCNSYAELLSLAALWDRLLCFASHSMAQIRTVCVGHECHSVVFLTCTNQCSRNALDFPHRSGNHRMFAEDSAVPLSLKITSTGTTISRNFRTTCCLSALCLTI